MAKILTNLEGLAGSADLSSLGSEYVETKVDTMNQRYRLPSIILVDTSGSMSNYENLLRTSVASLYDAILKDVVARSVTELSVMSFNSEICILEKLREIKQHEGKGRNLDFTCGGVTLTGLAVKAALTQLEKRIEIYRKTPSIPGHYVPVLFIVSDGVPECYNDVVKKQEDAAMAYCKKYIREKVAANKLVVVAVEVGNRCDHQLMTELTGLKDDRHVTKVNNATELVNFFKITSSILITSSNGSSNALNSMSFSQMK